MEALGKRPQKQLPTVLAAGSFSPSGFSPSVCICDCAGNCGETRRIIQILVPGRDLTLAPYQAAESTVKGGLQPLANGVFVTLQKTENLPSNAQSVPPFECFDPVGSWEWRYVPDDGVWEFSRSFGLAHGIFALELQKRREGPLYGISAEELAPSGTLHAKAHSKQHGGELTAVNELVNDDWNHSGAEVFD